MTTTTHDPAVRQEGFIRHVRRVACNLARLHHYFTADTLSDHIPKPPEGVDPRVIGNALHGLRCDGLIEPVAYRRSERDNAHGRPQTIWKAKDPDGLDAWLRRNTPGDFDPPTIIQLTLPF